jgi:hypothetical protein
MTDSIAALDPRGLVLSVAPLYYLSAPTPAPRYPDPDCGKLWQQPACLLWWRLAAGRWTTSPLQDPRIERTPISGRKSRSWTHPERPKLPLLVQPRNNSTAARSVRKEKPAVIRVLPKTARATLAQDAHATAKSSTVQSWYVRQVCRLRAIPHGMMLLPRTPCSRQSAGRIDRLERPSATFGPVGTDQACTASWLHSAVDLLACSEVAGQRSTTIPHHLFNVPSLCTATENHERH